MYRVLDNVNEQCIRIFAALRVTTSIWKSLNGYNNYNMAKLLKSVEITIKVIDANKEPKNDHLS